MPDPTPNPAKNTPAPASPAPQGGETPDAARERQERQLDEALEETFPASDPIALSPAR